ncbi:peptidoglycan-binding protein [Kaistia geumhonensis]|uniref:Peptidoglycan binding-like domain-containing protein n=1 Tax=Kaistia geumhonensis TaxID=410839 RepID=A0ABU0M5U8_9HYPH|nr:peptidoglycan-binding protein [Kaistia geumhonensis]MCX5478438.1 peptidoglycan-binding protein [Kaistia geumhonensis]MDQ0516344.1 hypothetical protein [Kaistia geumhonensis]
MSVLDAASAARLRAAHPLLQKLFEAVAARTPIIILESQRGRAAQEEAFRKGNSKAHFGDSAHNWSPSVALDVAPRPLDWGDRKAFIALSVIVFEEARRLKIPIRWGGDWNGNGVLTDEKLSDLPHYELKPWRDFAKRDCVLFGEAPKPPPAAVETRYPVLRRGSKGTDVIELQRQLQAAGIDPGAVDGDYGDKTFAAIRELQRRRGLERDGVAGPKTRAALADLL